MRGSISQVISHVSCSISHVICHTCMSCSVLVVIHTFVCIYMYMYMSCEHNNYYDDNNLIIHMTHVQALSLSLSLSSVALCVSCSVTRLKRDGLLSLGPSTWLTPLLWKRPGCRSPELCE